VVLAAGTAAEEEVEGEEVFAGTEESPAVIVVV
jgi:hypothetical protein